MEQPTVKQFKATDLAEKFGIDTSSLSQPRLDPVTQCRIDGAREILIEMREAFATGFDRYLFTYGGSDLIESLDCVLYLLDRYEDWQEYLVEGRN